MGQIKIMTLKVKGLEECVAAKYLPEIHAELVRSVWSWCVHVRVRECMQALAPHEDSKNKY